MNKNLIYTFKKLNAKSESLLSELNQEKVPSPDDLTKFLDDRESTITELKSMFNDQNRPEMSGDEKLTLDELFDEFEHLNISIQKLMSETLMESKSKLDSATRQRKAEEGYQVLNTPDNSYLSRA